MIELVSRPVFNATLTNNNVTYSLRKLTTSDNLENRVYTNLKINTLINLMVFENVKKIPHFYFHNFKFATSIISGTDSALHT